MPPQQAYGLLDFVDEFFCLCTHGSVLTLLICAGNGSARTIGTRLRPVKQAAPEYPGAMERQ
jgi:hypothetical protein